MRFRANGSAMACHSASDVSCRWRRSVLSQCASPSFGKDVQMREIHGMTDTSTYITWREIKQRCANKRNKAYPYYGGRGITYCKEWESFVTFLRDMGERPSGTSLDRINNDGPYSPENCKWSTRAEQARNRRGIKLLTFKGKTR